MCVCPRCKRQGCQEWDSNPRLQGRLRPERSALDRSAILTAAVHSTALASQASGAHARARARKRTGRDGALARAGAGLVASGCSSCRPAPPRPEPARRVESTWRRCWAPEWLQVPVGIPAAQHARPPGQPVPGSRSARDGRVSSTDGEGVQRATRWCPGAAGPGPGAAAGSRGPAVCGGVQSTGWALEETEVVGRAWCGRRAAVRVWRCAWSSLV